MPRIFGHEVPAKTLWIGGGLIAAAVAVVVFLRARAASQAAAQPQMPDQSQPDTGGGGGGGYTVAAPTQAAADQYQQQMAQDSLAAQGAAYQYLQSLQQQQQAAQRLQETANPLQTALSENASFFAANPLSSATPTGVVQQRWQQFLLNGQTIWEDVSGKHRAPITEALAEAEASNPKGEGPYYQSKGGGFFGPLLKATSNILRGVVGGAAQAEQSAASAYFQQQGVPFAGQSQTPAFAPPVGATQMSGGFAGHATVARAPVHAAPHGYHEIGGVG